MSAVITPIDSARGTPVARLREPPHSIESESSVLGGLLLQPEAWDRVGDLLHDSDFYRYEHRLIFSAIGQLALANKPVDVITVFEHLQRSGLEESAGGLPYLNSLAQYVPSAMNIRRYAEIVRERAIRRKMAAAGDRIAAMAYGADGRDVAELQDEAEAMILGVGDEASRTKAGPLALEGLVARVIDEIQERADNPQEFIGTPTGFVDYDRMSQGMQAGDLIVIAARPSMGKTSLAINIAEHVAIKQGLPVAVYSMEMSAMQLTMRIIGSIGRIDHQRLRTGTLEDHEWPRLTEAIETLRNVKLHIDESPALTVSEVRASARRLARVHGKLGLVVVDYLQLMEVSAGMAGENRATAVGELSRGLKMLAKELGCPVIALSQLSRGVEQRTDKRPLMSDLRESGAIEQDADTIIFIYRDDYYHRDSREPGVAELIVAKQRSGPTGSLKLAFVKQLTRFDNLAAPD
jgi:replicative DNA helicase